MPFVLILGLWIALAVSSLASAGDIRVVSVDRYTNGASYHRTEVEPDTYSFGTTVMGVHQTGRFQDGGSSNVGYVVSTDGGLTWSRGFLPGTTVFANPAGLYTGTIGALRYWIEQQGVARGGQPWYYYLLVVPLYLVWTWQRSDPSSREERWTRAADAALWIALVPLAVSLPFLWWDPSAFIGSVLSPAMRPADGYAHVSAVGSLLGLRGGLARIPLLVVVAFILLVAAHRQVIGRYTTVLLMFVAFTDFNTVLFPQYFAWVIPFIVLAAVERGGARPREIAGLT